MKRWELQKCEECEDGTVDCCPICKGTGYSGLIIYDPVCAALFLGRKMNNNNEFIIIERYDNYIIDFIMNDENADNGYGGYGIKTTYNKLFVTLSQLREVIEYRGDKTWCITGYGGLSAPAYSGNPPVPILAKRPEIFWNRNLLILADNAEEAQELIYACWGKK